MTGNFGATETIRPHAIPCGRRRDGDQGEAGTSEGEGGGEWVETRACCFFPANLHVSRSRSQNVPCPHHDHALLGLARRTRGMGRTMRERAVCLEKGEDGGEGKIGEGEEMI